MRVLFEGHTFSQDHGGISRMWKRILPLLVDLYPDVQLALQLRLYRTRSAPQHPLIRRITHIEDTRLSRIAPFLQWVTQKRQELFHPDIYQAMSYSASPIRGCLAVQCVYDCIHEAFPAVTGNPAFSLRKRTALETADHLIAISHATKADVTEFFDVPPEKVSVIHLAADPFFHEIETPEQSADRQHWLTKLGLKKPFFLFVGNRGNYKNFFTLLHAFGQSGLGKQFDLVAIGGEAEIRHTENEFVIKNGLERSLRLLPRLEDAVLRHLYRSAVAFCYPSLKEGFGIPVLEAMAAGCPVVASHIPVFEEIGLSIAQMHHPSDPEALAHLLQRVASWGEADREIEIRRGREIAASFNWENAVRNLYTIYERLLRSRRIGAV